MPIRRTALAAVAALLFPVVPAGAGPLDPPKDRLRVWLVEFVGSKPTPQKGQVHITGYGPGPVVVEFIGFEVRHGRRDLLSANGTTFLGPGDGNYNYPSAYVAGHGQVTPACTTEFTCAQKPAADTVQPVHDVFPLDYGGYYYGNRIRRSFYVVALNAEVSRITDSPGWKPAREISAKGFAVRVVGHTGTGVYVHGTTWEHFTGPVSAPGGRHGSIVYASIPCMSSFGPFLPEIQPGTAKLLGGDPPPRLDPWQRTLNCASRQNSAIGAATRRTTWTLDGESFGWAMSPYRLAVVDLPRFG